MLPMDGQRPFRAQEGKQFGHSQIFYFGCKFFTPSSKNDHRPRRPSSRFIHRKILQNPLDARLPFIASRLYLYMKKLLLLSAVLLGAVSVSQAGVRFNFGLGLPLPPPPIIAPAPPAYVAPAPAYGYTGPYYDYSAPCYDYSVPYVAPPVFGFGFGNYGHPYWGGGHWGGYRGGGFHGGFRGGFAHRR